MSVKLIYDFCYYSGQGYGISYHEALRDNSLFRTFIIVLPRFPGHMV